MSNLKITLNGDEVVAVAGLTKVTDFYEKLGIDPGEKRLYLKRDDDIDIPLLPEDHLVIHGGEEIVADEIKPNIGENPSLRHPICPEFNGQKLETGFAKARVTSDELMQVDGEFQPNKLFADLKERADAFIAGGLTVVVQEADAYFTIPAGDDDAVDLEACARTDRKPPKGQSKYKIKVDGEKYTVVKQQVTGEEILALVEKGYDEWTLNQKLRGGRRKPIEKSERVDLAQPGIERFETVRKQAQQGFYYPLPDEDVEFLRGNYSNAWEQVGEADKRGLVISNYRLPCGYAPDKTELMLLIPANYPTAGIDMFYFSPSVARADGQSIDALSDEFHFGQQWQRWSRHYEWRPGEDCIATHIAYVGNQLKFELGQGR